MRQALKGDRLRAVEIVVALVALAAGAPGCVGLAAGLAPRDWPIPLSPQLWGDFALRTTIYLSGFLAAFGALALISTLRGVHWLVRGPGSGDPTVPPNGWTTTQPGDSAASLEPAPSAGIEGRAEARTDARDEARADARAEAPVSLSEPLYGFLPGPVQIRIARETGYNALLFTKVSILLTAGAGVLLAGSWEPAGEAEPIPPAAAARIGAGLYLLAESVYRYIRFARGEPSGGLAGTLVHGASNLFRLGRGDR